MTLQSQDGHDHGFDMWTHNDRAARRAFAAHYWAALRQMFVVQTFTLG